MGLIKLAVDVIGAAGKSADNALNSGLWKEYFTSGDMSSSVLMKRAEKVMPKGSVNKRTDDNLISSGSGIDVQDNQCMIIVENGRVVEVCTEPGRYTYNSSTAPSLFCGNNKGIKATFGEFVNQMSAGGQRFSTQRVYFINMGRIWDPILWGLGNVGFVHTFQPNPNINPIRMNVKLKAHGSICTRIENPLNFYKEIGSQMAGGDNNGLITVKTLGDSLFKSMKTALTQAVSSSLAQASKDNPISYTEIMIYADTISKYVTDRMANHSLVQAGFGFYDFYIDGSPEVSDEDYKRIMDMEEKYNMVSNPMLASYDIQKTFATGFQEAGKNGGVSGIMGMGMAMGGGGFGQFGQFQPQQNMNQGYQGQNQNMGYQGQNQNMGYQGQNQNPAQSQNSGQSGSGSWTCSCGTTNHGNFCLNCGNKKPQPVNNNNESWTCSCGTVVNGRFCFNCGAKKPENKKIRCDKCGWTPPEGFPSMRFCPECGDPINEADLG